MLVSLNGLGLARRVVGEGQGVSAPKVYLFGDSFEGSTLESLWASSVTGSGFTFVVNGAASLGTSTTANSTAKITSTVSHQPQPGLVTCWYATVQLASNAGTAANNTVRFGLYDTAGSGYGFSVSGSVCQALRYAGGSAFTSSLSGPGSFVLDTNAHAYEILSYGNVAQLLQDGIVLHTFNIGGTGHRSIASPATFECNNSGGSTTSCTLNVQEVGVGRYGGDPQALNRSTRISTNTTTTLKSSPGVLTGLLIGVGGSASTATIYDNTAGSGTVLATLTTTGTNYIGPLAVPFYTGLTVVTAGTGAADLAVHWR